MKVDTFDTLLQGESPAILSLLRSARIAAKTDVTLLLLGESGTGKELLAKAIHHESLRHNKPFITINCAALPEALAESELFGHRKGAFTGAHENALGRIKSAEGGTLFLDEIGELPLAVQAKLLRFLESGECHALGESKAVTVNTRIVTATNRDLQQEVKDGHFRKDLFYRLNIVPLQLPPLRERHGDIEKLITRFTAQLAQQHGLDAPRYNVSAMEQLQRYDWPGNVRELRNLCERMLILLSGQTIKADNLPLDIKPPTQVVTSNGGFFLPEGGIILEDLEADLIHQALDKSHGNQSKAARLLGLTRSALLYRMKKHLIA